MPSSGPISPNNSSNPAPEPQSSAGAELDLQALAKKVYELLKKEARLEGERLGRPQS